jgi:hypothetical protein
MAQGKHSRRSSIPAADSLLERMRASGVSNGPDAQRSKPNGTRRLTEPGILIKRAARSHANTYY